MSAEIEFNALMEQAEAAAYRKSKDFTSRLQTSASFTARKQFRKAGRTVTLFVVGRVPLVGSAIARGVEWVLDRNRKKKIEAALRRPAAWSSETRDAVFLKANAKSLAEIGATLDRNILKHQAAFNECQAAAAKLNALANTNTTAQAFLDAFKKAAITYYRWEHYNEKLAETVDMGDCRLRAIAKFTEDETQSAIGFYQSLKDVFEEAYPHIAGESDEIPLLQGRPRSSSTWN